MQWTVQTLTAGWYEHMLMRIQFYNPATPYVPEISSNGVVTQYASIVYYGLNEKIGNISYYDSSGQSEFSFGKPYSENTARTIDEEVKRMTDMAYERTKQILTENRDKLTRLAEKLLEKEVIFKEDLEEIFGKRPFDKHEEALKPETEIPPVKPQGSQSAA